MEILRDPIWQFVGVPLALLGVLLAYWTHLKQATYKEFSAGEVSARELLQVSESIADRVAITLDGKPVDHVTMVVYAVKNSGNVPILASDFIRPIELKFQNGPRIVSAHVSDERPTRIGAQISISDTTITIAPTLLNPLDIVELQILVEAKKPTHNLDTRIVDVSVIGTIIPQVRPKPPKVLIGFRLAVIGLSIPLLAGYPVIFSAFPKPSIFPYFLLTCMLMMDAVMAYSIYDYIRSLFGRVARRYYKDA